jgi:hypothetical protein
MVDPSFLAKKDYCVRTRRSNYAASLRLSGFKSTPLDVERPLLSREDLLKFYGKYETQNP